MIVNRAWIAAHIPHQGNMCLLDGVKFWSEEEIICRASSHRLENNPLRTAGSLGIANGIEYSAQAMAVHSALLTRADEAPNVGFLTSVRDVQWHRDRLDDIGNDLTIRAARIFGNDSYIIYSFSVHDEMTPLLTGRASILVTAKTI